MDWTILDGFDRSTGAGEAVSGFLRRNLAREGRSVSYFTLRDMKIAPCRSCGACGFKSPGRCIVDDDVHEVLRAIASSHVIAFLTPIRFGGYSSQLKKATDKMMPLGLPLYIVRNGRLLHPMRYGRKPLFGIGVAESTLQGQEEAFRLLVERNAMNILSPAWRAVVVQSADSEEGLELAMSPAMEEALRW